MRLYGFIFILLPNQKDDLRDVAFLAMHRINKMHPNGCFLKNDSKLCF